MRVPLAKLDVLKPVALHMLVRMTQKSDRDDRNSKIRSAKGTASQIAKEFKVSESQVWRIRRGATASGPAISDSSTVVTETKPEKVEGNASGILSPAIEVTAASILPEARQVMQGESPKAKAPKEKGQSQVKAEPKKQGFLARNALTLGITALSLLALLVLLWRSGVIHPSQQKKSQTSPQRPAPLVSSPHLSTQELRP
jgi:hypothetical protein